jgi:hypothetical protein
MSQALNVEAAKVEADSRPANQIDPKAGVFDSFSTTYP